MASAVRKVKIYSAHSKRQCKYRKYETDSVKKKPMIDFSLFPPFFDWMFVGKHDILYDRFHSRSRFSSSIGAADCVR